MDELNRFANEQESALISEGVCPVCKQGELIYVGLCKPKALTDWSKQQPAWDCDKCGERVVLDEDEVE